jgi:hypothetical protein
MQFDVISKTLTSRVRCLKYPHTKPAKYEAIKKNLQKLRSPRYRCPEALFAAYVHAHVNTVAHDSTLAMIGPSVSSGLPTSRLILFQ